MDDLLDDAADIDGMLAGPATPPAAAAPAPVAPTVSHRSFSDPKAVREAIYAKTLAGFKALQPIANARYSLSLHDVDYADPGEFTAAERKRAILEGRTLSRRLRGTWKLADATTGEPVASRKSTLANVPYYTDKGTFVLHGSDWTLAAQMRLLPGVYSRRKDNGELESHVNVMPGKGLSHRIQLDPAAGVFTVKAGGSTFPLLPILRSLGAKDEEIREAWGDLLPANAAKADPRAVRKFHDKVVRSVRPDDVRTPEDRLRETLAAMPLDPRVTRTTLGAEFSGITPAAYLAATKRLIGINRGEQDPDDRDHLAFMHVLGQEDLIAERVLKDLAPIRRALWKATMKQGDLSGLPAGVFTDALNAAIQRSGLGQVSESVNPSMWMEQMGRVSRMGVGGIPDTDAIPDECYDEETEVFTSEGWKPWRDVAETTRFGCLIGGTLEFHEADRLIKKPYEGVMYGIKTRSIDHLVTPGHRIWCQKYRGGSCLKRCGPAAWGFELAAAVHRKPRSFQSTHAAYAGVPLTHYQPPISPRARKVYAPFAIDDWAEFVGWYVAEGSVDSYALHARNKFHITISQNVDANPAKVAAIADLLVRMGIRHSYQGHNFVFVSGHIGAYLLELGIGAENKRLPTEAFDWPISARRRLLDAMVSGDGHRKPTGSMLYATTSPGLHADFVRLAVGLGYAAAENTPRLPRKKSPDRPDCKKIYVSFLLTKLPQGVSCSQRYDDCYRKIDYSGMVYCAEVPGERLLVRRHGSLPIWSGNSKSVQPSHLGFVDPIATPENSRAGVDSRFASPILKGDDGKVYTRFRNLRTGEQELVPPDKLVDATIAFPNEMRDLERRYVNAMRKGRMLQVPRDEVDYAFERMEDAFSPLANLVPMKSGIKGQRLAMGSRMSSQALPLVGAEAPLVQNLRPDVDESYEKQYGGAMGAIRADADAWVKDVTDDGIVLQDAAGKERTVELTRHEPTNRKTGYHQTAVVQPGQPVRAGELLARSNYTDAAGTTALGRNVRIAMIPGFGSHSNYEDAWVISQGAAEKFKSEHYYQHAVDEEDGQQIGRKEFLAAFPAKYSRKMLDGFTDDGVIKVGTRVEHGDPLVLAIKKRTEDRSKVYRGRGPSLIDAAETWDHHSPGVVTDVVRTKEGAKVVVRTEVPAQVADKLCVSADHEVLTSDRGWIPIAEVGFDDLVAVPGRSGETEFRYPTAIYHYAAGGRMYALETAEVSLLATAAHRLWARRPQDREFSLTRTDQAYLNHVIHATSGPEGLDRVRDADMSSKIESWVEDYAGPVYCLSVPGEVFYVRRNGKAHWTGNSNRFGGKGVIASIVPDEEMPRDEDGHIIDLLFNPAGVISRSNPAAALEIALGKIAAKTGEPYRIRDFDKIEDLTDFTQRELEKHGVSDEGSLTDPRTGRKIPGVMTGSAFFMKLHHMAADKNQGRGTGGYSEDGQPSRGGDNAAKRMALMSLNALLSHGGTETIKDALHVRGQANPEFWARFMAGHAPPIPEVPFVHRKFVQQMKASGINVTREGSRFKIHALRGKDVDSLVEGRILKNAETADYREGLKPVKGGLFDEAMTGGHGAGRWAGIALAEPMVSPVFEDPARRILGLTEQGYRDVIAGKSPFRGRTGPGAIASALESMDLKAEIAKARAEMTGNSKTRRDDAIKRLKYLKSAEKDGIHPGDWVWDKVPVLPPAFRPVSISKATGQQQVADPNVLYGELFEADKILRSMHGKVDDLGAERLAVYDALKAVVGLGDPIHPKTAARGVRGLLKEVMGDSPKYGTVQRKLLSAPVDLVGRSVIVPDPDLDLDSVGVPETHAWEVYKPFIVRRLVRRGASFSDAARAVRDRTDVARGAMLDEMETRPVILDRAPVLHRYGVLAFKPKLVKGDAIRMAPLVTSGFGADFDGDQMNYQVPSGEAAVREAYEKLLPSRNLISPANFKVHQLPSREYAAGLWLATKPRPAGSRPRTFATAEEAIKAYRRGEIDADQDVEIAR